MKQFEKMGFEMYVGSMSGIDFVRAGLRYRPFYDPAKNEITMRNGDLSGILRLLLFHKIGVQHLPDFEMLVADAKRLVVEYLRLDSEAFSELSESEIVYKLDWLAAVRLYCFLVLVQGEHVPISWDEVYRFFVRLHESPILGPDEKDLDVFYDQFLSWHSNSETCLGERPRMSTRVKQLLRVFAGARENNSRKMSAALASALKSHRKRVTRTMEDVHAVLLQLKSES